MISGLGSRFSFTDCFLVMKGREDDNIETIKKRFKVFVESTLPVVRYYESKGKLRKVRILIPPPHDHLLSHFVPYYCF